GVVEPELALADELQDERPDERLGDAADARIILDLHRALGGAVGQTRGTDPGPVARDPDADDGAWNSGVGDGLVERLLELALDRRRERGRRLGDRLPGTIVGGARLPGAGEQSEQGHQGRTPQ